MTESADQTQKNSNVIAWLSLIVAILAFAGPFFGSFATMKNDIKALKAHSHTNSLPLPPVSTSVPVGTIHAYGGPVSTPTEIENLQRSGWLLCDGSTNKISAYPELFKTIGKLWSNGQSPGEDNFKLPDLRGMFLRGLDANRDVDPEGANRSIGGRQEMAVGSHNHHLFSAADISVVDMGNIEANSFVARSVHREGDPTTRYSYQMGATTNEPHFGVSAMNGGPEESRPVNVAVNFIIKY